jgi:hypothetical protein
VNDSRAGRALAILEAATLSAMLLPFARVAAWYVPLPDICVRLERWLPGRHGGTRLDARTLGRIVTAVGRGLPGIGTCLTHALVAEVMMRREGHAARIVIGVERQPPARLAAHAWVESAGEIVVGSAANLDRFTPLAMGMDSTVLRSS